MGFGIIFKCPLCNTGNQIDHFPSPQAFRDNAIHHFSLDHASPEKFAKNPFGFIVELLRPSLIAWALVSLTLGISYGAVFGDLETFMESLSAIIDMMPNLEGFAIEENFLAVVTMIIAITAVIGPMMQVNRMIDEEKKNRTEPIYARAIQRNTMQVRVLIIACIGITINLLMGGLGLYAGIVSTMNEPIGFFVVLGAVFNYSFAMFFMIGFIMLLGSLHPRISIYAWVYLAYSFMVLYIGSLLNLPTIFGFITPFGHVAQMPIESFNVLASIIMLFMALVMIAIAMNRYRHRDLIG